MKRHPALVHLSHNHHHTLVWARRLQRGETAGFDDYRRDLARHFREEEERVFPLLAEFVPEPPDVLAREAAIARDDEDRLDREAIDLSTSIVLRNTGGTIELAAGALSSLGVFVGLGLALVAGLIYRAMRR